MDNTKDRVIQIAGSCHKDDKSEDVKFSHVFVAHLTNQLLKRGAIITTAIGKEENKDLSNIYYWDVLEAAYEYSCSLSFSKDTKNRVKVVSSEKAESQIPESRKQLWKNLISKGVITIHRINPGWNSGAYRRQKQEALSDGLITLGGGEGIEHLTFLYVSNGKPVLPLDMPLNASCKDGLGGSRLMFRRIVHKPEKYLHNVKPDTSTKLISLKYENWNKSPKRYAQSIITFLNDIICPQVFYIRLLDKKEKAYLEVETFFRKVVDNVVISKRYCIKEMERSETKKAFINSEMFEEIAKSTIVIADLSKLRNNCFMEMGYAFGENKKVLVTAKKGTNLPFDSKAIPCYFWDLNKPIKDSRKEFQDFWGKNINREPLVPEVDII